MENRRKFIKKSIITGVGLSVIPGTIQGAGSPVNRDLERRDTPELINCYYYAPHNHTMLSRHIEYDLEKMVSIGTNVVSFCVQEEQLTNWHSARVKNFIRLAHKYGLKVHAVPNRWAGLLAGWLDGYSRWTILNQDTWYTEPEYKGRGFSDPAHPKVKALYEGNVHKLVDDMGVDGIIWDEPRPPKERNVIRFLDDMSAYAKSIKPDIVTSIFAEAGALHHAEWYAETSHIDYLGADGHLRSEDHEMHRMKNTIFTTHAAFYPKIKAAGKKTMFLIEGQRHRDEDLENYLENLEKAFTLPMDQLMYYYSAHEMSIRNEDIFNRETWKMIKKITGK